MARRRRNPGVYDLAGVPLAWWLGGGAVVATGAIVYVAAQKPNNPAAPAVSNIMTPGRALMSGQYIKSPNGVFTLAMQSDGNLVLYQNASVSPSGVWSGTPVWATGTNGKPVAFALMQTDGNLVLYNSSASPTAPPNTNGNNANNAYWASNTNGQAGAYAVVGNDGSFAIFSPSNPQSSIWHAQTKNESPVSPSTASTVISAGQSLLNTPTGSSATGSAGNAISNLLPSGGSVSVSS
jgi:hypothetical protein